MNAFDWLYKLCRWGLGIIFIYAGCVKLGYKNVYRYPGGIFAWKGADYPVEAAE